MKVNDIDDSEILVPPYDGPDNAKIPDRELSYKELAEMLSEAIGEKD